MNVIDIRPELHSLFSIDASSHLAKVSAHYFSYPEHYLVEWVRMALKGGATKVEFNLSPDKLEMRDDGAPIDAKVMEEIARLLETGGDPRTKEEIIASFLDGKGIGWLAIFGPGPVRVEWEYRGSAPEAGPRSRHDALEMVFVPGHGDANRLSIRRPKRDWRPERDQLREYCRFAAADIIVNGEPVEKGRDAAASMVSLSLGKSPVMRGARLWIPRQGMVCRVWLLHRGIIWSRIVMPSWNGFVFEAAVEADGPADESFLETFRESLQKLYLWMAHNYHRYPVWARRRVDELFFSHFRLTADDEFLSHFAPFQLLSPPRLLSLPEVKKMGRLVAVSAGEARKTLPDAGRRGVFSLTTGQRDFLVNTASMQVVFLDPAKRKTGIWIILRSLARAIYLRGVNALTRSYLVFSRNPVLTPVDEREAAFIQRLTLHLKLLAKDHAGAEAQAFLVDWPGFAPLRRLFHADDCKVFLRRRHPLVNRSMELFFENSENMEIVASWVEGDRMTSPMPRTLHGITR